jgi:hypothetical protein
MKNFEFKSQVATSKEQCKRLLELGLKKETADMVHYFSHSLAECWTIVPLDNGEVAENNDLEIPAWSLHRLLFLIPKEVNIDGFKFPLRSDVIMRLEDADNMYERLIGIIERVIKEGYFNKDYLEEKK